MDEYLKQLNREQLQAVTSTNRQCMIKAGPGTGKTSVITGRIMYLIEKLKVAPFRIMALTFSVKATKEMRERVTRHLGDRGKDVKISTFHSCCAKILMQVSRSTHQAVKVISTSEQTKYLKSACQSELIDPSEISDVDLFSQISSCKNNNDREFTQMKDKSLQRIAQAYQRTLKQFNCMDFDDLLVETLHLLQTDNQVRSSVSSNVEYLLVDEFQDTNDIQYQIAKLLSSVHSRIFIVGDPDQNIFQWRSASSKSMIQFQSDYPSALVITLQQNYRSTANILNTAMALLSVDNTPRVLHSNAKDQTQKVVIKETIDDSALVRYLRREIVLLKRSGFKYKDIAILYRCNFHADPVQKQLSEWKIPFQFKVKTNSNRGDTKEIISLLHHMQLINDPYSISDFFQVMLYPWRCSHQVIQHIQEMHTKGGRVPIYQIMRNYIRSKDSVADQQDLATLSSLSTLLQKLDVFKKSKTACSVMTEFLNQSQFLANLSSDDERERCGALTSMIQSDKPSTMQELISLITQFEEEGGIGSANDKVVLSTLHSSKGLEWPVTFILNVVDGEIPYVKNSNVEEERRLFYVGLTRAKQRLYVLASKAVQDSHESVKLHESSVFLSELKRKARNCIEVVGLAKDIERKFDMNDFRSHAQVIKIIEKERRMDEEEDDRLTTYQDSDEVIDLDNKDQTTDPEPRSSFVIASSFFMTAASLSSQNNAQAKPAATRKPFRPPRPLNSTSTQQNLAKRKNDQTQDGVSYKRMKTH